MKIFQWKRNMANGKFLLNFTPYSFNFAFTSNMKDVKFKNSGPFLNKRPNEKENIIIDKNLNPLNHIIQNNNKDSFPPEIIDDFMRLFLPHKMEYQKQLFNFLSKHKFHYIMEMNKFKKFIFSTMICILYQSANISSLNKNLKIKNIIVYNNLSDLNEILSNYQSTFHNRIIYINENDAILSSDILSQTEKIYIISIKTLNKILKKGILKENDYKNSNLIFYQINDQIEYDISRLPFLNFLFINCKFGFESKINNSDIKLQKIDIPTQNQILELKPYDQDYYFMIFDENSDYETLKMLFQKNILNIIEKQNNSSQKVALFLHDKFFSSDFEKKVRSLSKNLKIDIFYDIDVRIKSDYDIIIDSIYFSIENFQRKMDLFNENCSQNKKFYSFFPKIKLEEILTYKKDNFLQVNICDFDKIFINKKNGKDEFQILDEELDVFNKIRDKLSLSPEYEVENKPLEAILDLLKEEDEINENIIIDFLYEHQDQILKDIPIDKSLLTGKEYVKSITFDLFSSKYKEKLELTDIMNYLIINNILKLEEIHNRLKPILFSDKYMLEIDYINFENVKKYLEELGIKIYLIDKLPLII